MKASKIKELIKDLPDDVEVHLCNEESDHDVGLTAMYPARIRTFTRPQDRINYGYSEILTDWQDTFSHEEIKTNRFEIVITSKIPAYYLLSD